MPELPEIHRYSKIINNLSSKTFTKIQVIGGITKRHPEIPFSHSNYFQVKSLSRGKEQVITIWNSKETISLLFNHGLVGKWELCQEKSMPKGTRLRLTMKEGGSLVWVDTMNIGRYQVGGMLSMKTRGPDPVSEKSAFVENLNAQRKKLIASAKSSKAIGELMLDQQYFNGIGNYLRAEILAHAKIDPFESIASVLRDEEKFVRLVESTHAVPKQVIELGLNKYGTPKEKQRFQEWLTCYEKGKFKKDSKGRKMYYLPMKQSKKVVSFDYGFSSSDSDSSSSSLDSDSSSSSSSLNTDSPFSSCSNFEFSEKKELLLLIGHTARAGLILPQQKAMLKQYVLEKGKSTLKQQALCAMLEALHASGKGLDFVDVAETLQLICSM